MPTAEQRAEGTGTIGLIPCLAFAVGTMVGGGVFTLSGEAINDAGPAAIASYMIAGAVMLLSALSCVTVASRTKPGESGYGPLSDILGDVWRFVAMWGFYLNGLLIVAFLVVSFGHYLHEYFVGAAGPLAAGVVATIALMLLNLGPVQRVSQAETYVVGLKIGLLAAFAIIGLTDIGNATWSPFAPDGADSMLSTTSMLLIAYTGFFVITNMASSVKNPERTVPLAVVGSVLISAVIYIGVVVAMLASGVDNFGSAGLGQAADALVGDWGGYVIAFAACLSTLSGANANILGSSEIMLRLVARGDVPPAAGRTHRGHPVASVCVIAAVTVVLVLWSNINTIVTLANISALTATVVMNVAAFRLARQGWPGKGSRLPGGPVIPAIATVACLVQFPSFGGNHLVIGAVLLAAGLVLYALRHHEQQGRDAARNARARIAAAETPLAIAMRPQRRAATG